MNSLEKNLQKLNPSLYSKLNETKTEVNILLSKYANNFPDYTDHSMNHTLEVFSIASDILSDEEIANLNADEIYILSMACLLHDIGMCIPEDKIQEIYQSNDYNSFKESHPNWNSEDYIRSIHHQLSNKFIQEEWVLLKIESLRYAKAIGIVAEGHRKVDLGNFEVYNPQCFVKSGKEYVCLPYLSCILRIADELDVTNSRTPKILTKYYMPNNEISIREWQKHIATSQRNYIDNKVIFEVDCSDQNIYAALQEQFEKIQDVINYCQKIKRAIPFKKEKQYDLNLSFVDVKYNLIGFDPKGIKFSFDVQNVVTAFIGEDLYKDKLTSLREAIQNSIDSCRFKTKVLGESYIPSIKVYVDESFISVDDNGAGMDEFIIENYFGRLASSFYEQEKIKSQFEAIGQFGVGVFSYFLLSEYIDIETKSSKSNTLKFRFDKDPKSYFHFYDKTERMEVGTTITMYLKKELYGKLQFSKIEEYIKTIFKHIEIPIEIIGPENHCIIEYQSFEINEQKEINNRLKLQHKKFSDELICFQVNICDEEIEGNCALICGRNYLETFLNLRYYLDFEHFGTIKNNSSMSQISISQKGVFVNNYPSFLLNYMIGDINIKKKVKINIDRNEFSDENQIEKFIFRFEIQILKNVFHSIKEKYPTKDEFHKLTNNFLCSHLYYLRITNENWEELVHLLKEFLHIRLYSNEEYLILSLGDVIEKHHRFFFISDKENVELIYQNFKIPIAIANGYEYEESYNSLREILISIYELTPTIRMIDNMAYELLEYGDNNIIRKENISKIYKIIGTSYYEVIEADSEKILVSIWKNKVEFESYQLPDSFYINYNHHFIEFIIANYINIQQNPLYKKIIKSAFNFMYDIQNREIVEISESIVKLNEILNPLRELSHLEEFKLKDFYS